MPTSLTDFDPDDTGEVAESDPAADITLDDLGEDKELNTPPKEGPTQEEPEEEPKEEAEPEPEKAAEQKPAAAQAPAPKTDEEKTTEEILKYLGLDSTLKIKGKEYSLKDFEKEDLLSAVQKGFRFDQKCQELAKREALVAEREKVAESNAQQAAQILGKYRESPAGGHAQASPQPPEELKPSEYDTEDVKAVKQAALTVWQQNQEQAHRLNAIEGGLRSQASEAQTQRFLDELQAHRADFPLASTEEVIAVHSLRPDIPLADLVRRSHAIYGSVEHVEEVLKHSPETRKAVEDKIISAYLARNAKAKVIPEKPASQGSRTAPAQKARIGSFDDAGQAARKALAKIARELEGDSD